MRILRSRKERRATWAKRGGTWRGVSMKQNYPLNRHARRQLMAAVREAYRTGEWVRELGLKIRGFLRFNGTPYVKEKS